MEATAWRKIQESTADMAKAIGNLYKEFRCNGFSRSQAFVMVKDYMLLTAGNAMRTKKGDS